MHMHIWFSLFAHKIIFNTQLKTRLKNTYKALFRLLISFFKQKMPYINNSEKIQSLSTSL